MSSSEAWLVKNVTLAWNGDISVDARENLEAPDSLNSLSWQKWPKPSYQEVAFPLLENKSEDPPINIQCPL